MRVVACRLGLEPCVFEHRLGQPRPDIGFAPAARRFQLIETEMGDDARQEGARVFHLPAIGSAPTQIRFLHQIFRVGHRTEHAIGEPHQMTAMRLEARRRFGLVGHDHAACLITGAGAPPTVTRWQAFP